MVAATTNGAADEKSPGTSHLVQVQARDRRDGDAARAAIDGRPGLAQHALGVVARGDRLLDDRHAVVGEEAGQEHARLHLGRGDRAAGR